SIRRGISFERVCESAAILKRKIREIGRGPEIHIAYIMLADRMEAALKLPRIMAKIDADLAVISTLDYISHPSHEKWAILPRDKAAIEKARGILEKISRKAEADGRFIHFALPAENVVHENGCRENALKTLYIDADGFLSPCVYLNPPFAAQKARRKVFGDANAVDPLVLWNGEEWKNFRSLLRDRNPDPVCRSCPKRDES
nr:SPASM domain-containing protein [Desulfovibrio sp.]